MFNRDVTLAGHSNYRHKVRKVHKDQRIFSGTADRTHVVNTMQPARPMRGGIRL